MSAWLSVVGIGEDGLAGLSATSRAIVDSAELLVGGERHLALMPNGAAERLAWTCPLEKTIDAIAARSGRRVVVLASGDPMCFGVGATLIRRFSIEEMTVIPAPSAFSLACARLGWPLAEVETLSVHGRPLATVKASLAPGARLLLLTGGSDAPTQLAELLRQAGYGPSRMIMFERMGGPHERRVEAAAEAWDAAPGAALNTVAIECRAASGAPCYSRTPGLPDEAYESDGQLTKREVRAVTLAALAPSPGALLWDVGAGAGSIAIEWLRAAPRARAVAVERDEGRAAIIARNAAALGVPQLELVRGEAPAALGALEAPDAVFIGGGLSAPGLVETCWDALKPGGRLVGNAVTVEGETVLAAWRDKVSGGLTRLSVSRTEGMGAFQGWRALAPVTQLTAVKANDGG